MLAGTTMQQVLVQAQARLVALRDAIKGVSDFDAWISENQLSDLEAIGFSPTDSQALMTAFADANAIAQIYNGSEQQSIAGYNYSASQRNVIGPV